MSKLFLRDVGSHPERDLEVTLFKDGELQFEADNGKYVHINISREGVKELVGFLAKESRPTQLAADGATPCTHDFATTDDVFDYCIHCGEKHPVPKAN